MRLMSLNGICNNMEKPSWRDNFKEFSEKYREVASNKNWTDEEVEDFLKAAPISSLKQALFTEKQRKYLKKELGK